MQLQFLGLKEAPRVVQSRIDPHARAELIGSLAKATAKVIDQNGSGEVEDDGTRQDQTDTLESQCNDIHTTIDGGASGEKSRVDGPTISAR